MRGFVGTLWIVTALVGGLSSPAADQAAEPIWTRLVAEVMEVHDSGFVTNQVWLVGTSQGTNRFRVRPIPGWTLRLNPSRCRVEAGETNNAAFIYLRWDPGLEASSEEDLKALALARNPGFEWQATAAATSGLGPATAFDLVVSESISENPPVRRVVFVPGDDFLLECCLMSLRDDLGKFTTEFDRFLLALQNWTPDGLPRRSAGSFLR